MEEIDNEFRAVDKLCREGNPNIVTVLKHFCMSDKETYAIDMEYCDFTLEHYIQNPVRRVQLWPIDDSEYNGDENVKKWNRIGIIMRSILLGLDFIHSQNEIHRDLKPRNSISPSKSR